MTRRRLAVLALIVAAAVAIAVVLVASRDGGSAAVTDDSRPYVVWAVGDGADGGESAQAVADLIEGSKFDRLIYLGDVYDTGTREEFDENYAPIFGDLAAATLPTPGNHEWPNHEQGYDPYWAKAKGERLPDRYVHQLGGWKLVAANSEADVSEGSDQLDWLDRELSGGGDCRIVFLHRPRFNAGRHGDAEDLQPLWETVAGRAAILLSAHDHNMQRFEPKDGLLQLISGAGGHRHYDVDESDERLAFSDDQTYGALRLVLEPRRARLSFVGSDGRVLDRSTVGCSA